MARDVNLTSPVWCDLIFDGRNKEYGAYVLRQKSSDRHLIALIIVISAIVVAMAGIRIFHEITANDAVNRDVVTTTVTFDRFKFEEPKPEQMVVPVEAKPIPKIKSTIKFVVPVADKNAPDESSVETMDNVNKSSANIASFTHDGDDDDPNALNHKDLENMREYVPTVVQPAETLTFAEVMPSFPGGDAALMQFLSSNLKFPPAEIEQGISGRVVLRFVVGEDGEIRSVEIMKSLSPGCDKEALRVARTMPTWIPGRQNGKAVPVYFSLPIRFSIQ